MCAIHFPASLRLHHGEHGGRADCNCLRLSALQNRLDGQDYARLFQKTLKGMISRKGGRGYFEFCCFLPLRYVVDWRISWRGSWRMEKPHTANVWLGNNFFFSLGHRSFASCTPKLSAVFSAMETAETVILRFNSQSRWIGGKCGVDGGVDGPHLKWNKRRGY